MKNVEYRGKPLNFARLGELKKGDKIRVTVGDWDALKDDPAFILLDPEPSEGEKEAASRILPWGHQFFDLRTIPWEHPNLFTRLLARSSKPKLLLILNAIESIGGVFPESYDRNSDREQLVDAIVEASRLMDWDKQNSRERLLLPHYSELENEEEGGEDENEGEDGAGAGDDPNALKPLNAPETAAGSESGPVAPIVPEATPAKAVRTRSRATATA